MPYCQNCGSQVFGGFCQNCGQPVTQIPTQPYSPLVPPRPLPKRAIWAMIFAIISVIMIFIAGILTWWVMSIDMTVEAMGEEATLEMQIDFKLDEGSVEMEARGNGQTERQEDETSLTGEEEDVGDITRILVTLGIIMMIIVVILVGLMIGVSRTFEMARYTRTLRNLAMLFAFIALIFVLMAPIYYMIAWPSAVKEDMEESSESEEEDIQRMLDAIYDGSFAGSDTFTETIEYYLYDADISGESSWGPGIGWMLAIFCFIPVIITLILVKLGGDQASELAPSLSYSYQPRYDYRESLPYPPPPPQYPQQSQQPPSYSQGPVLPPRNMIETSCPTCGHVFSVMKTEGLTAIQCPNCGVKGTLK